MWRCFLALHYCASFLSAAGVDASKIILVSVYVIIPCLARNLKAGSLGVNMGEQLLGVFNDISPV